jgi:hypothetical protein
VLMPFACDRPAVAAWIDGLAIWPSNVAVTASGADVVSAFGADVVSAFGADVVSAFGAHQAAAVTQFALVESRSPRPVLSHGC